MKYLFLAGLLQLVLFSSFAQVASVNNRADQFNVDKGRLSLDGYDPVAYFKMGKAVKGKSDLSITHSGIRYQFSSEQNREMFRKQPGLYEPQYGGWCAYAMGKDGSKVEIDPETFKVIDGKLYVFYNKYFTNTLKSWNKDEVQLKKKADANWYKFYHL
ncbi:MAG: YHS domain protein [Chitinophagaceae bacterium]|nr:YHS domain protein [Chitinophagaceae bacterium]